MVPTASHGTCCLYANPRSTQEGKSSIEHQRTMSQVPVRDRTDWSPSSCSDNFILVEKSEESRIATLIKYEVLDSDPRELIYYINRVAEFGFNHIIIVGETEYGMIFLGCYGRVFMWDDESPMLWPLGNSPEEVPKQTIKLGWFVKNGDVYEYIRKPQYIYPEAREGSKNKRSNY
ncbi:unnamed protein product [Rhizophagus irregularis]|nr:unnamed protein product [Rhizophagus irregularis]